MGCGVPKQENPSPEATTRVEATAQAEPTKEKAEKEPTPREAEPVRHAEEPASSAEPSPQVDAGTLPEEQPQPEETTWPEPSQEAHPEKPNVPELTVSKADPFAAQPDRSEGLVNVSYDLKALLEHGKLKNACQEWLQSPTDHRKKLLCGKSMFFYEAFGTVGIPTVVINLLLNRFKNEVGPGFSSYGLVPDPYSTNGLPLGLAPSGKLQGKVDTVALTCASCHFGKMPDGRYAVGAPNHNYEYGKHMLAVSLFPMVAAGQVRGDLLDPQVQQAIMPLLQKIWKDPITRVAATMDLLPLASSGVSIPNFSETVRKEYASWPAGTMDFLTQPLPVDDKVHTVSKISALWGIPTPAERKQAGMVHAMLGWTGGTVSLDRFIEDFVIFGKGPLAHWLAARREPLVAYIHSLRAPKPSTMPPAQSVQRGKQLFAQKGCLTCHDGPRGSGKKHYTYTEIGTDDAMKQWMDPELDGVPCCGITLPPGEKLTHSIKSPRLVGLWSFKRFLHNGSLNSLEELFCVNGPRPSSKGHALGTQGHTMTCQGLTLQEKQDLIQFLKSN